MSVVQEPFNGIVYNSPDQGLVHLLLEDVVVKVLICDGKPIDGPLNALVLQTDTFLFDSFSQCDVDANLYQHI
jgi:hypothetical protein